MNKSLLVSMLAWLFCISGWAEPFVLHYRFDGPNATEYPIGQLEKGYQGTSSLLIENTDSSKSKTLQLELPADRVRGQLLTLSAVIKAGNVSRPAQKWNGIKVMLSLETELGKQHPQIQLGTGSFDWTPVSTTLRIPSEITKATLVLGLEQSSGKVWFDEVTIRTGRPDRDGPRRKEKFIGHDLPRLRGVMHGPRFDEENIRVLATEWKANQVRWQLNWSPMKQAEEWARDLDAYDQWLSGALAELDKAMDACEKYGLMMLVDLHCPPGGRSDGGVCRMFSEQRYQDKLIEVWDRIARQCKGRKCVYAYDLINEPVEPKTGATITWKELATKAIDIIRAVDPGKPVVFEPGPWGGCDGFDLMTPLDRDRVIYSFHMYQPHAFTHQGVHDIAMGATYPGTVGSLYWDKEQLRAAMAPAIDFQREFNVQMYVGEFSAIRWAPDHSAYRYLRDCIGLFEEYGWDWSYHAYREFNGWSVEYGPDISDRSPSTTQTDREKLLRDWFMQNRRSQ
jgi:endoglucanase